MATTKMKFEVLGARKGSFADKESGEFIKYCSVFCKSELSGKDELGFYTDKMSALPSVFDALVAKKLPAIVEFDCEVKPLAKGFGIKLVGVA